MGMECSIQAAMALCSGHARHTSQAPKTRPCAAAHDWCMSISAKTWTAAQAMRTVHEFFWPWSSHMMSQAWPGMVLLALGCGSFLAGAPVDVAPSDSAGNNGAVLELATSSSSVDLGCCWGCTNFGAGGVGKAGATVGAGNVRLGGCWGCTNFGAGGVGKAGATFGAGNARLAGGCWGSTNFGAGGVGKAGASVDAGIARLGAGRETFTTNLAWGICDTFVPGGQPRPAITQHHAFFVTDHAARLWPDSPLPQSNGTWRPCVSFRPDCAMATLMLLASSPACSLSELEGLVEFVWSLGDAVVPVASLAPLLARSSAAQPFFE